MWTGLLQHSGCSVLAINAAMAAASCGGGQSPLGTHTQHVALALSEPGKDHTERAGSMPGIKAAAVFEVGKFSQEICKAWPILGRGVRIESPRYVERSLPRVANKRRSTGAT